MTTPSETKSFEFEARGIEKTLSDMRRIFLALQSLQRAASTVLWMLEELGLPKDIVAAVRLLRNIVMTVQALRIGLAALQIQMGPVGWALIGAGIFVYTLFEIELERRERNY